MSLYIEPYNMCIYIHIMPTNGLERTPKRLLQLQVNGNAFILFPLLSDQNSKIKIVYFEFLFLLSKTN